MLLRSLFRPHYDADAGAGSGGAGGGQQPPNGDATGQQPPAGQQQNGGTQQTQEKTFTQADVDRIVADRLTRAQQKAQSDADKARQEAEAKALEQQGEFKTLAEQRAARLAELEPKAGQVERYEKALKAQVESLRKDLPDHLTALLDKMDAAEQLEYLVANRDKLVAAPPPAAPNINGGGGHTPPAQNTEQRDTEIRQRFRIGKKA